MAFHVFGYGSLVHGGTHDYAALHPARLPGWTRAWRATGVRELAYLTMVPKAGAEIWGAVAPVPAASWEALDAREEAYARHDVSHIVRSDLAGVSVAAYAIAPEHQTAPSPTHPVLQSYLDVVLAGYDALFGAEGVAHFLATTEGWDAPILQDRTAPRYPRAQPIAPEALARYDALLNDLGVTRI